MLFSFGIVKSNFCIQWCLSELDCVLLHGIMLFCLGLWPSTLHCAKSNYVYCWNHVILFQCLVLWYFVLYYAFLCWIMIKWFVLMSYTVAHSVQNLDEWEMGLVCQRVIVWLPEIIFTMFFCLYVTVHLLVLLSNIISKQFRKKLFSKEGTHRICCIFCINKERNHKKNNWDWPKLLK